MCTAFLKIVLILSISSCCSSSIKSRQEAADEIASKAGLEKSIIETKKFALLIYSRISDIKTREVNFYIEGDGFAWKNKRVLSDNPTPLNPIGLKIAAQDYKSNVIYISRPCQYIDFKLNNNCKSEFWSQSRFSQTVVDSINEAIDKFVKKYNFSSINLIGYSGGGAIVVLVASNRSDVKSIVTVAANLNHKELGVIHGTYPLVSSLNPIDFAQKIIGIPQYHVAGSKDKTIPAPVVLSFVDKINKLGGSAKFEEIKDATHDDKRWPEIVMKYQSK